MWNYTLMTTTNSEVKVTPQIPALDGMTPLGITPRIYATVFRACVGYGVRYPDGSEGCYADERTCRSVAGKFNTNAMRIARGKAARAERAARA